MSKLYSGLALALILTSLNLAGQSDLEVIRSTVLPWGSPVRNIFVDADNTKWATNGEGSRKVVSPTFGQPVGLGINEQGLFQFRGGNADVRWSKEELTAAIGNILDADNFITAAFYDEVGQDIWLGTSLTGAYRLKRNNGALAFQDQWSMDNTKLRSNYIHDIARDAKGRIWLATDDGALAGQPGKWDEIERGLIIESIAIGNGQVWLMGDGLVGKVNRRDTWELLDIPSGRVEGDMTDIALDGEGRLWIASRVISCYSPEDDSWQVFGGAEEYTSEFANQLVVDLDGAVWIGTEDKGLYVIQKGSSLVASVEMESPVTCNGNGADGALRVQVSGGTPPYTYEWSGSAAGENPKGLSPGTYKLTITDSKGKSREADISVPDRRISLTAEMVAPVSEGATEDGRAVVRAKGGMPPYSFAWDNGENQPQAMALAPGEHTVTVTDRLGCAKVGKVVIQAKTAALAAKIELVNELKCAGSQSAALKAVPQGGKPPYAFNWSLAGNEAAQLTGLGAGTYQVTITDAEGQTETVGYKVTAPEPLALSARALSTAAPGTTDGQAEASASGGTPPYSYQWETGGKQPTLEGLAPGAYALTVTDANNCKAQASVVIGEALLPLIVNISETQPVSCKDARDAVLEAAVDGGKPPYSYRWSHDALNDNRAEGVGAGTYELTVADAADQTATVSLEVTEPEKLKVTATVLSPASVNAADGVAEAMISGGTGDCQVRWTTGEAALRATQLPAGMATVQVTDERGCTSSATLEITEDILPLSAAVSVAEPIACAAGTGALRAEVKGGKPPFAYAWSDGSTGEAAAGLSAGAFSVSVTDAAGTEAVATFELSAPSALIATAEASRPASTNSSDGEAEASASGGTPPYAYAWGSGVSGPSASGLAPGRYEVTVSDANGCEAVAAVEVSENILPLSAAVSVAEPIACAAGTGALRAEVKGGKPPFAYAWSDGSTGEAAAGLSAGAFSVSVTDAAGTEAVATFELSAPSALIATAEASRPASTNSSDGEAQASASGGTPPYAYAWSSGVSGASASGLAPGRYEVTVSDANGCEAVAAVEVSENILPLSATVSVAEPIACAAGTGALRAEVKGGKPPFAYAWSDGSTGEAAAGLSAGAFSVSVTDAAGTEAVATFELSAPSALIATAEASRPASTNSSDGEAEASASGGTPPYAYAWSSGVSGASASGLAPGRYEVTVSDANGCEAVAAVEVSENILPLSAAVSVAEPIACAAGTGALRAEVKGGKPPFAYAWSDGSTGEAAAGLQPGSYTVSVADVAGNEAIVSFELTAPTPLSAEMERVEPAFSDTSEDGKAAVAASGGTPPYTYAWSSGATTAEATDLGLGKYTVTVADANSCKVEVAFEISERVIKELSGAVRSGQTIQMQKLQFEADSTRLTDEVKPLLNEIHLFLKDNPSIVVEIGGHTNNLPPDEYCDQLSTARARAVAEFLVGKGIEAERVFYKGYGKRKPLFSNRTEDGRRRNQRVEIKILRL
ncbi:OmpA family protein [Phaeodactylibacter luteus]|uniref:OmpA family protein n=1 Tax=Phaeodactylibacter luteus TaxID=1564516 RepID=A0A5C6RH76_9BACT|nr:OmpA family protein [Phaeodactylibacter luteus]TXB61487.1 OmpA family protein [Phaeodactylibacter luteus]